MEAQTLSQNQKTEILSGKCSKKTFVKKGQFIIGYFLRNKKSRAKAIFVKKIQ